MIQSRQTPDLSPIPAHSVFALPTALLRIFGLTDQCLARNHPAANPAHRRDSSQRPAFAKPPFRS